MWPLGAFAKSGVDAAIVVVFGTLPPVGRDSPVDAVLPKAEVVEEEAASGAKAEPVGFAIPRLISAVSQGKHKDNSLLPNADPVIVAGALPNADCPNAEPPAVWPNAELPNVDPPNAEPPVAAVAGACWPNADVPAPPAGLPNADVPAPPAGWPNAD